MNVATSRSILTKRYTGQVVLLLSVLTNVEAVLLHLVQNVTEQVALDAGRSMDINTEDFVIETFPHGDGLRETVKVRYQPKWPAELTSNDGLAIHLEHNHLLGRLMIVPSLTVVILPKQPLSTLPPRGPGGAADLEVETAVFRLLGLDVQRKLYIYEKEVE